MRAILITLSIFCFFASSAQEKKNYIIKKLKFHKDKVYAVSFSTDGKYLATGSADKTIKLIDINTYEVTHDIEAHYGEVKDIIFNTKGDKFYSAGDKVIKSWSTDGTKIDLYSGSATHIWSIGLSADESILASGAYEKYARSWDVKTKKMTRKFEGHKKSVLAVSISPTGEYLASGSLDQTVKLWNIKNGELIHTFEGHNDNIYSLDFTNDGKYLLSCSNDNTIKIWDVINKTFVITITGHEKGVLSADFSEDGKLMVSGSIDNTVKLWEIKNGQCIFTFEGHDNAVNDVKFSKNEKMIASGANDNTVILWEINPELFVNYYFENEFYEELDESGLWGPKLKTETKTEFKEREIKGEEYRKKLIEKYYQKYLVEIRGSK